jgi:hypothetical protein
MKIQTSHPFREHLHRELNTHHPPLKQNRKTISGREDASQGAESAPDKESPAAWGKGRD